MAIHHLVGGTAGNEFNGGGFDPATRTFADARGANGAVLHVSTTGTLSNSGGNVMVTDNGQFAVDLDGIYCYFAGVGVYPADRYKITASSANTITLDLAWSAADTINNCRVGGSVLDDANDATQIAVVLQSAVAGDRILVEDGFDYSADINISTAGTHAAMIWMLGVDSNGDAITDIANYPSIRAENAAVSNGIHWSSLSDWVIRGLKFDGNSNGTYACRFSTTNYMDIGYLEIVNAGNVGFYAQCSYSFVHDIEAHDNVSRGLSVTLSLGLLYNCKSYDNGGAGMTTWGDGVTIANCVFCDNGAEGIYLAGTYMGNRILNCTIDDNASHGIRCGGSEEGMVVRNNIISNNGGYGIEFLASGDQDRAEISYNDSFNNSDHCEFGTWADLGDGQLTLDPALDSNYKPTNTELLFAGHDDPTGNPMPIGATVAPQPSPARGQALAGAPVGAF